VGDWRKTVKSGASNHALIRLGGLAAIALGSVGYGKGFGGAG